MEACTNYFVKPNMNQIFNNLLLDFGIWMDGKLYWLEEENQKLITEEEIQLYVEQDFSTENALITNLMVENLSSKQYELKIICQYKDIPSNKHSSFIIPNQNIIFKSINENLYLINGEFKNAKAFCTVHPEKANVCEKTGRVSYCPTALKHSAGLFVFDVHLEPNEKTFGKTWVVSGQNDENLLYLNQSLIKTD